MHFEFPFFPSLCSIAHLCHHENSIKGPRKPFLMKNQSGTSKVGAISKAQKAQFLKYAWDVFIKILVFEPPPPPYKNTI